MKYNSKESGLCSVIIGTINSKGMTEQNVLINVGLNELRKMVRNFILKQIRNMKPDVQMVMWKTSIGEFTIFKEASIDYTFEPHKLKYNTISTKLEIIPIKGKVRTVVINSKKIINKQYEGFDECPNCNKKGLLDYPIVRFETKEKVCKKCYDFDKLLDKISKELDMKKGITELTNRD